MEAPGKALIFGAGLFLVLALIGLAVNVFSPSTDAAKSATSDFSNTTTELKDQKYLIYENTTISGSQVMNALRKLETDAKALNIGLFVQTKKDLSTGTWYYSSFAKDTGKVEESVPTGTTATNPLAPTQDINDTRYVNPSGNFAASVERDSNGVIRAVKFIQK